ncbi:MAG: anhydro-N-acetylmuramic acid kinase, partial [Paracoccaceae bacterium]
MLKGRMLWVLGAMSGTSLDGVDAALVRTDGITVEEFGRHAYRPYSAAEQDLLRAALGKWPGEPGVAEAAELVELAHAELFAGFSGMDLIGFHGQTLAHDPGGAGTHQAGNGALLAEALGVPVVWDFRSADVRMGGQGAPLAPFFHHALARHIGAEAPLVFLNLGGVGNVTWVDPFQAHPEDAGSCLAFDTGPANAPLNDLVFQRRGLARDEAGALAAEGTVNRAVIDRFLAQGYFLKMPPKSLDRNDFHDLCDWVADLGDADAAATLTAATVAAVVQGADHFPSLPSRMLVAGGGRHNRTMMRMLGAALPFAVEPVEAVGL